MGNGPRGKGYENEKGMFIKINGYDGDKGSKIDFYDKDPSEKDHKSIHVKVDYEKGTWDSIDNVNGENEKSSGGCYITSACMKHYSNNFDDNCYELKVLRWFRDNFVSKNNVEHYYVTAPLIVEAIDNNEYKNIVYDYIYDNVVDYCVVAIENQEYDKAYDRYMNSILSLEDKFARPVLQEKLVKTLKKVIA